MSLSVSSFPVCSTLGHVVVHFEILLLLLVLTLSCSLWLLYGPTVGQRGAAGEAAIASPLSSPCPSLASAASYHGPKSL